MIGVDWLAINTLGFLSGVQWIRNLLRVAVVCDYWAVELSVAVYSSLFKSHHRKTFLNCLAENVRLRNQHFIRDRLTMAEIAWRVLTLVYCMVNIRIFDRVPSTFCWRTDDHIVENCLNVLWMRILMRVGRQLNIGTSIAGHHLLLKYIMLLHLGLAVCIVNMWISGVVKPCVSLHEHSFLLLFFRRFRW